MELAAQDVNVHGNDVENQKLMGEGAFPGMREWMLAACSS